MPRPDACLEPWTMLGNIAAKNRSARLKLGVGGHRHRSTQPGGHRSGRVATLHLLTKGRAILGIGTGEREGNEPYGVDWSKPVGRFIEAVATIRALWDSGGEPVTRDSRVLPTAQRHLRPSAVQGQMAGDLDRLARSADAAGDRPLRRRLVSRRHRSTPRLQGGARRGARRSVGCRPRSGVDPRRELVLRRHRAEPRRRRRSARLDRDEGVRDSIFRRRSGGGMARGIRWATISPVIRTSFRRCWTSRRCCRTPPTCPTS